MCNRMAVVTVVLTMLAAGPGTARATLPDDQTIAFKLHETPSDPESDVILTVTLSLTADDSTASEVGWDVTSIEIVEPGAGGDTVWTQTNPTVDTPDGLWWVEHADTSDPQVSEFALPPFLEGIAENDDPQDEDLDYDFQGDEYSPPPGGAPYENTTAVTYRFVTVQSEEPVGDGEEEPSESQGVSE